MHRRCAIRCPPCGLALCDICLDPDSHACVDQPTSHRPVLQGYPCNRCATRWAGPRCRCEFSPEYRDAQGQCYKCRRCRRWTWTGNPCRACNKWTCTFCFGRNGACVKCEGRLIASVQADLAAPTARCPIPEAFQHQCASCLAWEEDTEWRQGRYCCTCGKWFCDECQHTCPCCGKGALCSFCQLGGSNSHACPQAFDAASAAERKSARDRYLNLVTN